MAAAKQACKDWAFDFRKNKETDAEWIARGGHLGTKWDAIEKGHNGVFDWLYTHKAHLPEYDFWLAFFSQTVADALGLDAAANRPCLDCHREASCHCFKPGRQWGANNRKDCTWDKHTVRRCAWDYIMGDMAREDCELLGIEVDYLRRLVQRAKTNIPRRHVVKAPVAI